MNGAAADPNLFLTFTILGWQIIDFIIDVPTDVRLLPAAHILWTFATLLMRILALHQALGKFRTSTNVQG